VALRELTHPLKIRGVKRRPASGQWPWHHEPHGALVERKCEKGRWGGEPGESPQLRNEKKVFEAERRKAKKHGWRLSACQLVARGSFEKECSRKEKHTPYSLVGRKK